MKSSSSRVPLFESVFYFMRHGETESNRLQTIAGSIDVELNDAGRAQARAAIELVRPLGVTRVVSSAQRRARDTAAIIAGALSLPHVVLAGLAERNWGEFEGKPRALRVRGVTPPGAETGEQYFARVKSSLAGIEGHDTTLVVAHAGTFRVLCRLFELKGPAEPVANCRPVRFKPPASAGGTWSLEMI